MSSQNSVPSAETPPDELKIYTQEQAAERCGVARTTILRMEQRKELPQPVWRRLPVAHRVYSKKDVEHIKQVLRQKGEKVGRVFEEEPDDGQAAASTDEG